MTATIVSVVALAVGLVGVVGVVHATAGAGGSPTSAEATPTPTQTPRTAAQQLLATTTDPDACAVSFDGDGIAEAPQLQTQGRLYAYLPIPTRAGEVFAGWYATAAAAAAYDIPNRVNGADVVACTGQQITLHGAWKTTPEVTAEASRVPILMYHQFTTKPEGESNSLRLNYVYTGDFDAQMSYLAQNQFYLPTWDELSAFIDGRLWVPHRSVIVTDDDADITWLTEGVPIIDTYRLLSTSFVITKWRSEGSPSTYVLQRSHTNDMHDAGPNGKGRMVNDTVDQIVADMNISSQILGAKEVMAYPFGDYSATAEEGLREAGYEMARTINQGYVTAGTNKLELPCIRINYGTTLSEFISRVG